MKPNELRQLLQLLKALEALKHLKQAQDQAAWIEENRELLSEMSPDILETAREQAEYDEAAWQRILKQLRE